MERPRRRHENNSKRPMNDDFSRIRSETRVLDGLIKVALAEQGRIGPRKGTWALLVRNFDGASTPAQLVADPVLEPVDKVVWLVMELHARRDVTTLPRYPELARQANVTTSGTVARAMAMLRCTRWLTVCERCWGHRKRRRGNVYVLHSAPLALADTMFLDPGYLDFLDRATRHYRKCIRPVAQQVLGDIPHLPH
jgi:hypothetical protein